MERLRHALGVAYTVGVSYPDHAGATALVITATFDAARSAEAVHLMMEEIDRLRAGGRDLAEPFVRGRREVLRAIVAETSGARSRADRIAALIADGEDLGEPARLAREVSDLAMNDARLALGETLAPSRRVIALLGSPASVAAARRVLDR